MQVFRLVVGPIQANCYLVSDDEGASAIIDPGGDAERIEEAVRSMSLTPRHIICTHGHPDHVFAAGSLQQIFGTDVLVHDLDAPMVVAGPGELAFLYDLSDYVKPALGDSLTDGQFIEIGTLQLQVIHTPGHTPGGVSLLCARQVFTGDTLFANGVGRTDLPGGSEQTLLRSIESRLLTLDDNTRVCPGHGPETTVGIEKQSNPWLRRAT